MSRPTEGTDLLLLDRQLCFPLYVASNLLTRAYRPALSELGLTYPQYLVMLVLWEHTPQTVGSLGDRLYLDSGTLTPLLKRLELAGLVTRVRDAQDERRVLIDLTDKGDALQERAVEVPKRLLSELNVSLEDLENLRGRVKALIGVLEDRQVATADSLQAVVDLPGLEG